MPRMLLNRLKNLTRVSNRKDLLEVIPTLSSSKMVGRDGYKEKGCSRGSSSKIIDNDYLKYKKYRIKPLF